MPPLHNLSPHEWAHANFGSVQLGNQARTARATKVAAAMLTNPPASLPQQLARRADLVAAYRLLNQADVTHAALIAQHTANTRVAAAGAQTVLFIGDTTLLDFSHHPATSGLGAIGDGRGHGFYAHSVLAVVPHPRQLLGLAHQALLLRNAPAPHDSSQERKNRARESAVWWQAVEHIGRPPAAATWVHVGDRGADIFEFMHMARAQGCHFLLRVAQDRVLAATATEPQGPAIRLKSFARTLPALDQGEVAVAARGGQAARQAEVALGLGQVQIKAPHNWPRGERKPEPISAWVVRVWEVAPPPGAEALEWILVSSLAVADTAVAWERVEWYKYRWLVEDYHQCLKTGCGYEQRQLHSAAGLQRLLGLCAPIAARLLQLREIARLEPEALASEEVPGEVIVVVSILAGVSSTGMTNRQFWRAVAQLGGHQGRKRDGPPGWLTIWRGWQHIQTVMEGVHLATRVQAEKLV